MSVDGGGMSLFFTWYCKHFVALLEILYINEVRNHHSFKEGFAYAS